MHREYYNQFFALIQDQERRELMLAAVNRHKDITIKVIYNFFMEYHYMIMTIPTFFCCVGYIWTWLGSSPSWNETCGS